MASEINCVNTRGGRINREYVMYEFLLTSRAVTSSQSKPLIQTHLFETMFLHVPKKNIIRLDIMRNYHLIIHFILQRKKKDSENKNSKIINSEKKQQSPSTQTNKKYYRKRNLLTISMPKTLFIFFDILFFSFAFMYLNFYESDYKF